MAQILIHLGLRNAVFGRGTGTIWLDNLYCDGTESALLDCRRGSGVGNHNCGHSEDASARCLRKDSVISLFHCVINLECAVTPFDSNLSKNIYDADMVKSLLPYAITEQFSAVCNDGDLQLVNGDDEFQGRVEICNGGVWGTVCHDWWNDPDNRVVCRQLGYGAGESKYFLCRDSEFGNTPSRLLEEN